MIIGATYDVISGQTISRIACDEIIEENKLLMINPAAIGYGLLDTSKLSPIYAKDRKTLKNLDANGKIAYAGDVVIKLSVPYDASLILDIPKDDMYVIPSYTCILRLKDQPALRKQPPMPETYLCALFNSDGFRSKLLDKMSGEKGPVLRIDDIRNLDVPVLEYSVMEMIGELFMQMAYKRQLSLRQIADDQQIIDAIISRYI